MRRTEELAVMWDTFRPLRLTELARALDDPAVRLLVAGGDARAGRREHHRVEMADHEYPRSRAAI